MRQMQRRRDWLTSHFMAVACALALLASVPSAAKASPNQRANRFAVLTASGMPSSGLRATAGPQGFVAILPLLFTGVLSPLTFFAALLTFYKSRVPQTPLLAQAFERPPPRR